jgi:nicotinate-nucleotide pyrophosphorylase (carboxylating)
MTIDQIIQEALKEDIGAGDFSSLATIPASALSSAKLVIKQAGILAGIAVAQKVFEHLDPSLQFVRLIEDGEAVKIGDIPFIVSGSSISILSGERLALNFMQRMSGIATATSELMKRLEGTKTTILDTRKTTPLLRELEKYAVRMGGGSNHRFALYDMIMIKDNHIDFAGGISKAIIACQEYLKENQLQLQVEIEVRNMDELKEVLAIGQVNRIMLDNFSPSELSAAIQLIDHRYQTEASGGITAETIRDYALTGVDFISVGALTHHIKSLDMSLISHNV